NVRVTPPWRSGRTASACGFPGSPRDDEACGGTSPSPSAPGGTGAGEHQLLPPASGIGLRDVDVAVRVRSDVVRAPELPGPRSFATDLAAHREVTPPQDPDLVLAPIRDVDVALLGIVRERDVERPAPAVAHGALPHEGPVPTEHLDPAVRPVRDVDQAVPR